ncbi:MAG TPA: hypothetical protein PK156_33710 [Polyangium sp.]|nr:hypothetical protein [Polyangium sp.]
MSSKPKVYIDPVYWGTNAETVANLAEAQIPTARFAIGPESLNESRPERDISIQVSAQVKSAFASYRPTPPPPGP